MATHYIHYWWERGSGWQVVVTDDYGGGLFEIIAENDVNLPFNPRRFRRGDADGLASCIRDHYPNYTITKVKGD